MEGDRQPGIEKRTKIGDGRDFARLFRFPSNFKKKSAQLLTANGKCWTGVTQPISLPYKDQLGLLLWIAP